MKKLSLLLAAVLICASVCPAFAQARASDEISYSWVTIAEGEARGEIEVDFTVCAKDSYPMVGVWRIFLFQENGQYVETVWGSADNGLLSPEATTYYSGTYTFHVTPGVSYYAAVTLCAGTQTDYDTRLVKTAVVTAPY